MSYDIVKNNNNDDDDDDDDDDDKLSWSFKFEICHFRPIILPKNHFHPSVWRW